MMMSWLIVYLSLAAWGWFNQHLLMASLLGLVIGLAGRAPWRWEIELKQFYRIGDLATALVVLVLLYGFFAQTEQKTVFIILQWIPFCFAPLLIAQLLSSQRRLPLGVLFYSVRNRPLEGVTWLDFKLPFAGIALLSAGAGNDQSGMYFFVVVAILTLLLWHCRPQQSSVIVWCLTLSLAAVISFNGQLKLRALHNLVEEKAGDWFSNWRTDPFKSHTSIGDIGDLKLSDKIVYRIRATEPLLLMQSSYDRYLGQSWLASRRVFRDLNWDNEVKDSQLKQMTIAQFNEGESILALPAGVKAIAGLEGAWLQTNELGAVKLSEAPDFVKYKVYYDGRREGAVSRYDLDVPKQHRDWVEGLKQTLRIDGQPAKAIAQSIERYFHSHFYYTLFLGTNDNADQALRDFILKRKAGHCEYFAVASVLLLRSYGIPARLANGYAMQEYDDSEGMFIVRKRHAHAWAIAYIDGYWQPVDSTPSQWLDIEEENADPLQPVYDWFSALLFDYQQWRLQQAEEGQQDEDLIWIGIAMLLSAYLCWRLYGARRQLVKPESSPDEQMLVNQFAGLDSEFYQIEQALKNTGRARLDNELFETWIKRINDPKLTSLMQLHYRYRFDPDGLTEVQRKELKLEVRVWLDRCPEMNVPVSRATKR